MLQLIVEQGQPAGQTWPLSTGLTSIGRGANNDIVLSGNQVSRVHCVIEMMGSDEFVLTDKSTNGTQVNGRRAGERTPLKGGDRIQIGDIILRCETAAPGAEAFAFPNAAPAPWPEMPPASADWAAPAAAPAPAPRRPVSNAIPIAIGVIAAILILVGVIGAAVLLSGRGDTTASGPTPTATVTASVSAPVTATVTITATAVITPTAIVTTTLAPASVTIEGRVTSGQGANVRSAPGTSAPRLYLLAQQSLITALGRNDVGDWLLIQCQAGQPPDQKCWIFAALVNLSQPADQLPIVQS